MTYNKPTEEEMEYLASIKTQRQYGQDDRNKLYNVYNRLFNANKRPTSCGRCLANTHKELMLIYNREKNAV